LSQPISKDQITEWTENPVTIRLREEAEKELDTLEQTPITECLFPGEPQRSHESLVTKQAVISVWAHWGDFLGGDWDYLRDDEEDEDE